MIRSALTHGRALRAALPAYRLIYIATGLMLLAFIITGLRWDWLVQYLPKLWTGFKISLAIWAASVIFGFLLALPLGLAQVVARGPLRWVAVAYCTTLRGTPLLMQLWLFYFGLGAMMSQIPGIRSTIFWPYLREAWPFAVLALSLNFAAYAGEIMRGAFAGVGRGELEAGRAFGMPERRIFRRIWLPLALRQALPTMAGETVMQLKAIPLVATVTVPEMYSVIMQSRHDTLLTYEPLLLLGGIYLVLTFVLVQALGLAERRFNLTKRG
ncbi:ABC transporter permease [Pseudogemmobacter faecipullorum]|uniref:ABC transporter permease subunit n=1 Tax=Pseudogemmobacter faecipullorum TaxID=2755041 RepID=A0ABS8CKW7_9RHOB|nr:ABC transporter permease subunit [Pseudogemmobacter faecipullorum]MCB5409815.1 ABC transporter permease subunit [Pseudogemmobacter faecipullorum]